MKKTKIILILLISLFAFKINVFAASGSLSVSSTKVYINEKFKVSVKVNQAAAWNIHVTSTGPVANCSINQADATPDAMDTNKTFDVNCTATAEGTITIKLEGDVTSASDGNAVNVSGTKTVTVVPKPATTPTDQNTNQNSNLSKNNNLKSITIEGYQLTKINNNEYTLTVNNDVSSIKIDATAEDTKAKVSGAGKHELKVGENNIEVIVTSESGTKNKINVKITRRDGYYLEDLETLLKDSKIEEIDITIKDDSKITSQQLNKVKDSKKIVRLNYYDDNKKIIYSWIINGKKIKETKEFTTEITYETQNQKEINKASNYAAGLYVNFKHREQLPEGTSLKLYVGEKYQSENNIKVYDYNETKKELNLIQDNLKVTNSYLEINLEKGSEYFITLSNIGSTIEEQPTSNIFKIIAIVELIIIIVLSILCFLKTNKKSI